MNWKEDLKEGVPLIALLIAVLCVLALNYVQARHEEQQARDNYVNSLKEAK